MQYHASLITADGAYHCPVGSIRPFFYYTGACYLDPISNIIKKALKILEGLGAARLVSS